LPHPRTAARAVYSSAGGRKKSARRPGWSVRLTYLSAGGDSVRWDHRRRRLPSLSNTSELVSGVVNAGCYLAGVVQTSNNSDPQFRIFVNRSVDGSAHRFYLKQNGECRMPNFNERTGSLECTGTRASNALRCHLKYCDR